MDKLQIIERYNHKTKRCCMVSEDDATSSSDRRAIECPKAGNVRKMPDSARIDRAAAAGFYTVPEQYQQSLSVRRQWNAVAATPAAQERH